MLTLSVGVLCDVVGGELLAGSEETMVNGLATDSRDVTPGAAFVAFSGEHADGHAFLKPALKAGARALLVTRDDDGFRELVATSRRQDVALVLIDDALSAVQALASHHRERLQCPVIGITGSTGKTTTKDFVRSVLGTRLKVVATEANRNNELGVPLTIMEASAETEVLVVEMAMRGKGQIASLCDIARPTAGLVTNVGVSHVEILGSEEAIASAKGELVNAIPERGRVFLNGDDGWSDLLADLSEAPITRYGTGPTCDVRAEGIVVSEEGMASFTLVTEQGCADVVLNVPGRHNVYNALAAASLGLDLKLSLGDVVDGLQAAVFTKMRMETFSSASGIHVVNDAYNANPTSMKAALQTLAEIGATGKRVAVLGDMAELGSLSELAHFKMGEYVAELHLQALVTVGERARRIAEGATAAGMDAEFVRPCATAEEASGVLDDLLEAGDVVLVKASRVMGLERVVEGITQPHV
ncbi:MAG: UDP-N-acetylmuramoyl-tripeptide--D-alanyl-D-alanine ligase [Coriobacteriia bacterium]|nr:UDP-N-acetylmuramoyl-tripeptide--D-alanyl-D-alanine ligase [Coriobacteriia bacterium]MBN2822600.1 UDP-N-acetylmuramoyl-tripeptide--D-alanyl-D-alanine ligase [Coriobacteriia bacterium]